MKKICTASAQNPPNPTTVPMALKVIYILASCLIRFVQIFTSACGDGIMVLSYKVAGHSELLSLMWSPSC